MAGACWLVRRRCGELLGCDRLRRFASVERTPSGIVPRKVARKLLRSIVWRLRWMICLGRCRATILRMAN